MNSFTPLELKVTLWQKIFSVAAIILALFLFLGRFLWAMWHAPRGFNAVSLVLTLVISGFIAWWIYRGAQRMWLETGLHLRADEQNIVVETREGCRTLHWEEIYGFTTDEKSARGATGYYLSLRGRDDEILAQWDRNWCRFTSRQIQRGDEIEAYIREKLRALGRLQGEENAAIRLWEQLHPFSGGAALAVRTNYAWIGWVAIILFLPCAFFSWNHPTAGPSVGGVFLFFAALGLYLIVAAGTLRVDETSIETSSAFGRNRIEWSEVSAVKMDEQGNSLTFEGHDKRITFSGPDYWKNGGKAELLLFITAMCEKRGIVFNTRAKLAMFP